MKTAIAILVTGLSLGSLTFGQKVELKLDAVAAKAAAKNEVDLDGSLLKMALANLPQLAAKKAQAKDGKEPSAPGPEAKIPALLSSLTGVYVRNYTFENPGAYADSDLDGIRSQVGSGSGWSRIIGLKEKKQSTEVYLLNHGEEIAGALILVAEPKQLTVVHLTGAVTMAQFKELVNSDIKYDLSALMKQAATKQ